MCAGTWKEKVIYLPLSYPGKQALTEEGAEGMYTKNTNIVPFFPFSSVRSFSVAAQALTQLVLDLLER